MLIRGIGADRRYCILRTARKRKRARANLAAKLRLLSLYG